MPSPIHRFTSLILLIAVIVFNLLHVSIALADDATPPPPPTEEPAQPPQEEPSATEEPVGESSNSSTADQLPPVEESTTLPELLAEVPENTEVLVVDEAGLPVPLASQEAVDIILETDPIWCPEGVLPGGAGCSSAYGTIEELRSNMVSNTGAYTQNGVIYFTATAGASLTFQQGSLTGGTYNTLKLYDLTFQGGWNGSTDSPSFSGQTNFANNRFTVGTAANPWVGNITLKDFTFSNAGNTAITIITSSGDITLDNVDVANQIGNNAAVLTSTSGDITIQNNSSFDGDNFNGNGVTATTGSGAITVTDAAFQQFKRSGAATNTWDGLSLSAPTVTLTNVTSTENDGDGISITNANIVTLNNVTSSSNGTELGAAGLAGNDGSGVVISGPAGSQVYVNGGTFNNNQEYGVEIAKPSNTTLNIFTAPTCTGNDSNDPLTSSCYNVATVVDVAPPVITLVSRAPAANANGWNNANVTVTWSCTDALSGPVSPTVTQTLTSEGANQSATGTCQDLAGNTASDTQTGINIDFTDPVLNLPSTMTLEATSAAGVIANYSVSATDNLDPSPGSSCNIASGSAFAIGTTGVTCSATDQAGNTGTGSFDIVVQDTTPPAISPMADVFSMGSAGSGKFVTYASPATVDLVDGAGVASCTPPSGTLFPFDSTTVTCSATDSAGNTSSITFMVVVWKGSASSTSPQGNDFGGGIIVVTGGEQIELDCFTQLYAFSVKLTFLNLCGLQTVILGLDQDSLPSSLPDGYTFVKGVDVRVLDQGRALEQLPVNTGIQLDFPNPGTADYALMFWDGTKWIEITESADAGELTSLLAGATDPELYLMGAGNGHSKALTTEPIGIFVLAEK